MPSGRVLVIEDDAEIAEYIRLGLSRAGYQVQLARDGGFALSKIRAGGYSAIVLDRMLPIVDGLLLLDTLRADNDRTPVVILSALASVDERVRGLSHGADDYLVKPFHISELLARLGAIARRLAETVSSRPTRLHCRDLAIDLDSREVTKGGRQIQLNGREFSLLKCLLEHAGTVVDRATLLKLIWNYDFDPGTNLIDVHISRLRVKLDDGARKPLISTVRGVGYTISSGRNAARGA